MKPLVFPRGKVMYFILNIVKMFLHLLRTRNRIMLYNIFYVFGWYVYEILYSMSPDEFEKKKIFIIRSLQRKIIVYKKLCMLNKYVSSYKKAVVKYTKYSKIRKTWKCFRLGVLLIHLLTRISVQQGWPTFLYLRSTFYRKGVS